MAPKLALHFQPKTCTSVCSTVLSNTIELKFSYLKVYYIIARSSNQLEWLLSVRKGELFCGSKMASRILVFCVVSLQLIFFPLLTYHALFNTVYIKSDGPLFLMSQLSPWWFDDTWWNIEEAAGVPSGRQRRKNVFLVFSVISLQLIFFPIIDLLCLVQHYVPKDRWSSF